ncbi:MAG: FAD-dependent oxidoreductase [Sphingomonadales bacterium]|nr:FAD-dependent oxidoreductase [Sphingomonadales bacterium]
MDASETFDVVVVGSGAAGAMTALRAASQGLRVVILEKAHKFGGTSATSGGVMWIPDHRLDGDKGDSQASAREYLAATIGVPVNEERLGAYLDAAPEMLRFLKASGVQVMAAAWPDYFPDRPGARADRSVIVPTFDGRLLGDARYPLMREQYNRFKLFGRYSMDLVETFALMMQQKGWRMTVAKMITRYWRDRATRKVSHRDRRFTQGAALMGATYKAVFDHGVALRLETKLESLVVENGRVTGVNVTRFGKPGVIAARHGVMLAAGGFEWNQALRDRFYPVPGLARHSSTPEDANRGEALIAAEAIGADVEHTRSGWWIPTMTLPMKGASNFHEIHQAAFDVGRPWSVCVNRNGDRFVDEATGYDSFGKAMVEDQLKTGANCPCWLIFDAKFRAKFSAGGLMPTVHTPEHKLPGDWWDHYVFRADSIEALAARIDVPVERLLATVANMNACAKTGVDPEFGRGMNIYDQFFGDPTVTPNPNLGPIDKPPFYAVPINNGDLGTKGGLRCDARARVLDKGGTPIPGLYAAGNCSASPFGDCYPGAGATIGPAMTFGFVAANDIAERSGNQRA